MNIKPVVDPTTKSFLNDKNIKSWFNETYNALNNCIKNSALYKKSFPIQKEYWKSKIIEDISNFKNAPLEIQKDREIILLAAQRSNFNFTLLSDETKNDPDMYLNIFNDAHLYNRNGAYIEIYKPRKHFNLSQFGNDFSFLMKYLEKFEYLPYFTSEKILQNENQMLALIEHKKGAIEKADKSLLHDREFLLKAVTLNAKVLEFFGDLSRNQMFKNNHNPLKDYAFILEAATRNGEVLVFCGLDPSQLKLYNPHYLSLHLQGTDSDNEYELGLSNVQIYEIASKIPSEQQKKLLKKIEKYLILFKNEKSFLKEPGYSPLLSKLSYSRKYEFFETMSTLLIGKRIKKQPGRDLYFHYK